MTVSEMVELEEVQALLARGQEHGFLSIDEVAKSVEGKHLDEVGVELVEDTEARDRMAAIAEAADRPPRKLNLKADTSTDALQLFLKDVGRVPLLTAKQEVELA